MTSRPSAWALMTSPSGRRCRENAGKARGGVIGRLEQARWAAVGAATFARLMLLPVNHHALPAQVRTAPAW